LMGHPKGEYRFCSPHDHVNASQSTNDAYPTALHVGMALGNIRLVAAIRELIEAFRAKGREFAGILKMGRTQLQDAVPMTLGQEFMAFGETLLGEVRALEALQQVLSEINMGATAIGTGLNAPAGYAKQCTEHLARITGFPIHLAPDLIEATQDTQAFVLYSSCMKSLAIKLSKVCNDLRLLSSGPRCGFREINLPAKQPGSTIMPGKVNPVIPEVVNQVCFRVIGSDLTVTLAAEAGQLQLNVMEPVIAACIFEAQTMFINAARTLRVHCVDGITANPEVCRHYVDYSIGTVTALNPVIGYDRSTELAAEAMRTGRGILELVREKKVLTEEQIAAVLDPVAMTGQGQPV
jgi:aspartate ammonia-lyase